MTCLLKLCLRDGNIEKSTAPEMTKQLSECGGETDSDDYLNDTIIRETLKSTKGKLPNISELLVSYCLIFQV